MKAINNKTILSKLTATGLFLAIVASFLSISTVFAPRTNAAHEGGDLIGNSVFLNSGTMTKDDIQNFLVGKGAGLANQGFLFDCDAAGSQAKQIYLSIGAPCGQSNVQASTIIYYASQIYGINPQVILATMQKEQSLTTATNPTSWQLNQAMGYGCPTTGGCGASNFFYQIDNGTWVMRYHYERAKGNMSWWRVSTSWTCGTEKDFYKPNLYPGQEVRFYDQDNVMYRSHYIVNAATSSLYCYTPHTYNNPSGLYGLPAYGTTGRYYTGSYNFVRFFELWFGSTKGTEIGPSLYRMFNPGTVDHLYTARESQRADAKLNGYKDDGKDPFKIIQTQVDGTIPIYRLYNGRFKDNWLLPDGPQFYWGVVLAGYANTGVAFYAYPVNPNPTPENPVCRAGTVGVRQMWHGGYTEHFYATNGSDHTWALLFGGYVDDGSSIYKDANGGISFCVPV